MARGPGPIIAGMPRSLISKTCEGCGATFEVHPYRQHTARFCSRACKGNAREPRPATERFLERIDRKSGRVWNGSECWRWIGAPTGAGYGMVEVDGRNVLAHRFSYEHFVGPIPEGLTIDHRCRNTMCVRPDHLRAVTHRVNVLAGTSPMAKHAVATHCKHGHAFDEANTYWILSHHAGRRACRKCKARCERARQKRIRERSVG